MRLLPLLSKDQSTGKPPNFHLLLTPGCCLRSRRGAELGQTWGETPAPLVLGASPVPRARRMFDGCSLLPGREAPEGPDGLTQTHLGHTPTHGHWGPISAQPWASSPGLDLAF